jgi:hypothetical protein
MTFDRWFAVGRAIFVVALCWALMWPVRAVFSFAGL